MTTEINEEMLTAAAKVYARTIGDDYDNPGVYPGSGDADRACTDYRMGATKVIEAAWPHIEAEVRAQVAGEIEAEHQRNVARQSAQMHPFRAAAIARGDGSE